MYLEERFGGHLYRLGVKLLTGKQSRCFRSISVYTPARAGRRAVISLHPELYGPRAVEALAFQLGLLMITEHTTRYRHTGNEPTSRDTGRGWRRASVLALPDSIWNESMAQRLEGPDIEERCQVTPRLVQLRWAIWMAKTGNTKALFIERPDMSVNYVDEHLWCEVI